MARLNDVVFDCEHPASLARFWASVLDGYAAAPYDDAELARLAEQGITDVEDDPSVLVERAGTTPRLWFQKVPESKVVKNRVHLDIRCDDLEPEIDRIVTLGATLMNHWPNGEGAVLQDPEGNEFCVSL